MAQEEAKKEAKKEAKGKQKERRPQAQKRVLQSEKRRLQNRSFKASVNTAIRRYEESLTKDDEKAKKENLKQVYSLMDKGAQKGVFKLNKASRIKARMTARLMKKS